jgi:hypothetical protein
MTTVSYPVLFAPTLLTTAAQTLFTVDASPTTIQLRGMRLRVTNKTNATHTVTIYTVPSGDTVTDNDACTQKSISAYDILDIDVGVIYAGGTLQALADANSSLIISALGGAYYVP